MNPTERAERTLKLLVRDMDAGMWTVEEFGPMRDRVIELFGTTILATPFASSVDGEVVRKRIKELNPDCAVLIRDENVRLEEYSEKALALAEGRAGE